MRRGGWQGLEPAESRVSPERPGQVLEASERGGEGDMIWSLPEEPLWTPRRADGSREVRADLWGRRAPAGLPGPGNSRAGL